MKLTRIFIALAFLALANDFTAQIADQPREILGMARESFEASYYENQYRLWQVETEKDKKNAFAWWQKYKAQRAFLQLSQKEVWANNMGEIFKQLEPIVADTKKAVPKSFEYFMMESVNRKDEKSVEFLKKAYAVDPNRSEAHESMLVNAAIAFDKLQAKEIAEKMLACNHFSNANLMWNYNALQTVEPNGIFITLGDMDTVPRWVLQYGQGVREDVLVVNKWILAIHDDYRKEIFDQIGIKDIDFTLEEIGNSNDFAAKVIKHLMQETNRSVYMGCGTSMEFFDKYQLRDKMYLVGTAFKYSKVDFDNMAMARKNFEENYKMEYLLSNFQQHPEDGMVKRNMNLTYIPGLMKMKKYYETAGNQNMVEAYEKYINTITQDSGQAAKVKSWYE